MVFGCIVRGCTQNAVIVVDTGSVEFDGLSVKTESVPLGELKLLAGERALLFDEQLMSWTMGNCIVQQDTNGNRKILKKRYEQKIDNVAALMDAWVAYKLNKESFE